MPVFLCFVLLFLLSSLRFSHSSRVKFTNVICNCVDPTFCKFEKCILKAVAPGVSEISMHAKMLQLPVNDATVDLEVKLRNRLHQPALYGFQIDTCAFLRNKRRNAFANLIYEMLNFKKYSNMNHTCPINHDLILEKYRMDKRLDHIIPIPLGGYSMISQWYSQKVKRVNITTSFEIY